MIPALGKVETEDYCEFRAGVGYLSEFKASLNYVRDSVPPKKQTKKTPVL